eukprot:2936457-Amphidinium_carterae.1
MDIHHILKHSIPEKYVDVMKVPCHTPLQVLQETDSPVDGPERVDVLLVDAEGFDADIVHAFMDLPSFQPAMIVYERKHIRQDVYDKLAAVSYTHLRAHETEADL